MSYKRSYKKKSYSRPGYVRCGKMVASDAQKALAMAKYLKGIVNVEFKNHDQQVTAIAQANSALIRQLTNIAQGDTTNTRDGASIKIVSISFNYTINMNASATGTAFRVMLVLDRQTNEAIYTAGDLLEDTTPDDVIVSPYNLNNASRFRVLYDKVHVFSINGRFVGNFKFYKKLNLKLRYDNAAAAITSLTQSSLSLLTVSDEATNQPSLTSFIRLRYVDN